ncbi:lipase/acyltransferase domain-containing protein [Saccharopolyspora sp. 5N708]|uniref:lipase/acyltransferase domain-containing protein n=1 Tax=Saccharopolyspora sp. 5N708 TaxID=3457424 RepID=UPI003FD3CE72
MSMRGAGIALAAVLALVASSVAASAAAVSAPVVLFPAFHLTKLAVAVRDQATAPECPRSGRFEDWYHNDHPSTSFNQVCQDKLLTLRYDPDPAKPMAARFTEQPGVDVRVQDYGRTESAPFYEPLYSSLESAGHVRNEDIRVAGYDGRLTPDMGDFLPRAVKLIEDTYRDNGDRPVHLVGHSNGPLYAQYLLTHTTRQWREKYIHGFTPLAGNMPGQGLLYPTLFTGLNVQDFGYPSTPENAASSARLYLAAPTSYMSAADPEVFGDREVVVRDTSTGRDYTPRDYQRLLVDANLPVAKEIADHYIGFVRFTGPRSLPDVDVYAEKGSGVPTIVGAPLANLVPGQVVGPSTPFITRDGDGNQEDITNDAVVAWRAMPCFHFELTGNPGVDHFSLPSNPNVLNRLLTNLARPASHCPT